MDDSYVHPACLHCLDCPAPPPPAAVLLVFGLRFFGRFHQIIKSTVEFLFRIVKKEKNTIKKCKLKVFLSRPLKHERNKFKKTGILNKKEP